MHGLVGVAGALATAALWCVRAGVAWAEPPASPSPQPQVSEDAAAQRLRLDIEKQIDAVLSAREKRGLPRFETSVEVIGKSPQAMLARFFHGLDMECGPAPGGAPTDAETRAYRPRPTPSVDFLALARALMSRLDKHKAERYFLYATRKEDGGVRLLLRDGRLPASALDQPGTSWELIDGFPDLTSATAAWHRLERGMSAKAASGSDTAPAPFATTNCRPH